MTFTKTTMSTIRVSPPIANTDIYKYNYIASHLNQNNDYIYISRFLTERAFIQVPTCLV